MDNLPDLFVTPVKEKKVRNGITAYQYRNGTISIDGHKYLMYSMTEAVNLYRKQFPHRQK